MRLEAKDLDTALKAGGRVPIDAPGLAGSINLTGAMVDDLTTKRHTATVEKDSGPARVFSPAGTPAQHFAQFGWVGEGVALPGASTEWAAPAGARLTPASPVTLTWANPSGQVFSIRFAIDRDYMITATQTVVNRGGAPVTVRPFALVNRTDKTASLDSFNVHSGPIGAFDGSVQFGTNYEDVRQAGSIANAGDTDWLGFTDVYWLSALIPQDVPVTSDFRAQPGGIYRADVLYRPVAVAPGPAAYAHDAAFRRRQGKRGARSL